ncbi:MAG: hypothetical protein NTX25_07220 [Proteobacteria bacterium]|nr:hypothetical protein [Pseudomonadota bacterium]
MKYISALLAASFASALSWTASAATHPKKIALELGIDRGGLVLGGDFLIQDTNTESYGGYARIYSKDEEKAAPAIFAMGASGRGHVKSGIFEYYLSPGFGFIHHNLKKSELLLGPSLSYGLSAEFTPGMALGIENTKLYSWMGEYKGLITDTFLAQFSVRI